jgi:hypothetical protein
MTVPPHAHPATVPGTSPGGDTLTLRISDSPSHPHNVCRHPSHLFSATHVLRVFAITGIDRMIPNFTSLDQALAQTSADGSNGPRRADGAPEGSEENRLVAQHGTSELDGEAC